MFYFLASSFNVELVYVILKGITQFSYLVFNSECNQLRKEKLNLVQNERDGSATLILNKIKIKNQKSWEQKSHLDLKQDNMVKAQKDMATKKQS